VGYLERFISKGHPIGYGVWVPVHDGEKRFLYCSFLLVAILVLLTLILVTAEDAAALPGHSMHVSITPEEADAKVTESQLGAVDFYGNVTVEKPQGVERVTVTLRAVCDKGWPVVLSPQTIPFINPGTESFHLQVIAPPGVQVMQAVATVHATAKSPIWEDEQSAQCRVNVAQYYKFQMWTSFNTYMADPGETVVGTLVINNSGNGDDTFRVTIEDPPKEITKWKISENIITVPYGFYGEVKFTLEISEDWSVWLNGGRLTIIFEVISQSAEEVDLLYSKSYPCYVRHQGMEEKFFENWPTYVGYCVVASLILVPTFLLFRRRRRRKMEGDEKIKERTG